jgi:hypothetical protein
MFPYDGKLHDIANTTATSIDDVVDKLTNIDALVDDEDGLKWFNRLYLQITSAVRAALPGTFHNPAFLRELDVDFASLYFAAVRTNLEGASCPACWRVLFDARADVRLARVQFAIAGVNAHINHDLPGALVTTCRRLGLSQTHGSDPYQDFTELNPVLDTQITAAEDELKIRLDGGALASVDSIETHLAAWSVSAAREGAWTSGEVLRTLAAIAPLATQYLQTLDGLTEVVSKGLLALPL